MTCHIWSLKSQPKRSDYNGLGQRVSQEVSSVVTEYLLDVQPGLWKVIAATASGNTDRFIHDPMGIAQHEDNSGDWHWMAKDGLGTVRGVYDDTLTEAYVADRDPYGDLIAATGSNPSPFEYTGEPEDQNGLLHLRARYYDPSLAVFNSLDPLETYVGNQLGGFSDGPLSSHGCGKGNRNQFSVVTGELLWINGYAYANSNPANLVDPTGMLYETPALWNSCNADLGPLTPCQACCADKVGVPTMFSRGVTPTEPLFSLCVADCEAGIGLSGCTKDENISVCDRCCSGFSISNFFSLGHERYLCKESCERGDYSRCRNSDWLTEIATLVPLPPDDTFTGCTAPDAFYAVYHVGLGQYTARANSLFVGGWEGIYSSFCPGANNGCCVSVVVPVGDRPGEIILDVEYVGMSPRVIGKGCFEPFTAEIFRLSALGVCAEEFPGSRPVPLPPIG